MSRTKRIHFGDFSSTQQAVLYQAASLLDDAGYPSHAAIVLQHVERPLREYFDRELDGAEHRTWQRLVDDIASWISMHPSVEQVRHVGNRADLQVELTGEQQSFALKVWEVAE